MTSCDLGHSLASPPPTWKLQLLSSGMTSSCVVSLSHQLVWEATLGTQPDPRMNSRQLPALLRGQRPTFLQDLQSRAHVLLMAGEAGS